MSSQKPSPESRVRALLSRVEGFRAYLQEVRRSRPDVAAVLDSVQRTHERAVEEAVDGLTASMETSRQIIEDAIARRPEPPRPLLRPRPRVLDPRLPVAPAPPPVVGSGPARKETPHVRDRDLKLDPTRERKTPPRG